MTYGIDKKKFCECLKDANIKKMKPKYYAYVRVSNTNRDEESHHQRKAILDYAGKNRIKIENIYEDFGSGKNVCKLPNITELIEEASFDSGRKVILIFEASRISRTFSGWEEIKQKLVGAQIDVYAVNQDLEFKHDKISGSVAFEQAIFSAYTEYNQICERIRSDVARRRAEGQDFGRPPYGMMRENGKFVPNKDEQDVIAIMEQMWKQKKTIAQIEEHFNTYDIGLRGAGISKNTIRYILNKTEKRIPKQRPVIRRRKTIQKKSRDGIDDIFGKMNLNKKPKLFEVEDVLEMKIVKSGRSKHKHYLIKWKGYPASENSWEPEENLNDEAKRAFHS